MEKCTLRQTADVKQLWRLEPQANFCNFSISFSSTPAHPARALKKCSLASNLFGTLFNSYNENLGYCLLQQAKIRAIIFKNLPFRNNTSFLQCTISILLYVLYDKISHVWRKNLRFSTLILGMGQKSNFFQIYSTIQSLFLPIVEKSILKKKIKSFLWQCSNVYRATIFSPALKSRRTIENYAQPSARVLYQLIFIKLITIISKPPITQDYVVKLIKFFREEHVLRCGYRIKLVLKYLVINLFFY